MRFSWKVFVCTMMVVAVSFGIGGYLLINSVFHTAMNREIRQTIEANRLINFAFETAMLNTPSSNDHIEDYTIVQIFKTLELNQLAENRILRVSNEEMQNIYSTSGMQTDTELLQTAKAGVWNYKIIESGNSYYLHAVSCIQALDRELYFETFNSISSIYEDRSLHFAVYSRFTLIILLLSAAIMLFISLWLTRPIRHLSETAKYIASGDLTQRVKNSGTDEIGTLILDFNRMADALEEKIFELQETTRQQEDFVASFAHELKTPLTAIIGYADMLRSYKLDGQEQFQSANYIFEEGRRLENLSLKLMDIILFERHIIVKENVSVKTFVEDINQAFFHVCEDSGICLQIDCEDWVIQAEPDLLKTLLINLIDNARKASESGSQIFLKGKISKDGYEFFVIDNGRGIPESDIHKLTEAFYMVDKSRARSQNGSGLGLSLCSKILKLHDSKLDFTSKLGVGTTVHFTIKSIPQTKER